MFRDFALVGTSIFLSSNAPSPVQPSTLRTQPSPSRASPASFRPDVPAGPFQSRCSEFPAPSRSFKHLSKPPLTRAVTRLGPGCISVTKALLRAQQELSARSQAGSAEVVRIAAKDALFDAMDVFVAPLAPLRGPYI